MKLRFDQLGDQLQRQLAPVYLVTGDEPLQHKEAADAIRAAARRAGCQEREVLEVAKGFAWDQLAAEAGSRSLFAERRLLELRLSSNAIGQEGSKALAAYCAEPSADVILLVIGPKLESRQNSAKWVKAIEQNGVWLPLWPVEASQLPRWLEQRLRTKGLNPEPGVAAALAERVEGNLLAADQEMEKLLLLQGSGALSVDQLMAAVTDSARFDVFLLVDEVLMGRVPRLLRILAGLKAEGVAGQIILWALARELRTLYGMALEMQQGQSMDALFQRHRVWEKRKPSVRAALQRLSVRQLQQALALAAGVDQAIKGYRRQASPWLLLEQLSLRMAGCATTPG